MILFQETFGEPWLGRDDAYSRLMFAMLKRKYAGRGVDLVIAVGSYPLQYMSSRYREIAPNAQLLYGLLGGGQPRPPGTTGIVWLFDVAPTVEIALAQNPGTRRIVFVQGGSEVDRAMLPYFQPGLDAAQRAHPEVRLEVTPAQPFTELSRSMATLPRDTVVIFLVYFGDSVGQTFTPERAMTLLLPQTPRPIYSVVGTFLGKGVVGGSVADFEPMGNRLADIGFTTLRGVPPDRIPEVRDTFQRPVFDWAVMKRWGIPADRVPPGSTIINRQYTVWELYRWQILGGVVLIVAEAALILLMLRLRAVRRRAEQALARQYELELAIAELATALISLPSELVNSEIDSALQRLLGLLRLDRIAVFELSEQDSSLRLLAATAAAELGPPPTAIDARQAQWAMEKLLRGEPVLVSRLEDLPVEALSLKELAQRQRVKSIAIFPLRSEAETFGALAFSAMQHEVEWTADRLQYLKTVSDIFGTALQRRRVQEALISSEQMKSSILSSLNSQIAVLDRASRVIAANDQWEAFTRENSGRPDWMSGSSALFEVCRGCETACEDAESVWEGIQRVCRGERDSFEMEYECPSLSGEKRWFLMTVTRLRDADGGAVIAHHDISESKRSEQAIRDLSGKLITAQEEERSRIARELHDDINQQLALLAIDLQRIEGSLPGDAHAAHSLLHELWKKTNGVSADIQRISHQLHSAKLEHLGLISALRGLCHEFSRQQKMGIEFHSQDVPSHLDRGVALSLFRIAQECLRNAGKHSQARNVRVELAGEHGGVVLRVTDDGMGFDPGRAGRAGLGMVSMQERLRLVGGRLRVSSARSAGTRVEATVPLSAPDDRDMAHAGAERKA